MAVILYREATPSRVAAGRYAINSLVDDHLSGSRLHRKLTSATWNLLGRNYEAENYNQLVSFWRSECSPSAEQPRTEPFTGQSQQQNQRQNVEITQQARVENATDNSAIIAWTTNVQAGTRVRYGTDRNSLSQTATAPWGAVTHRVESKNLRPNTTYYYQIISEHASGTGTSADRQHRPVPYQRQRAAGAVWPAWIP